MVYVQTEQAGFAVLMERQIPCVHCVTIWPVLSMLYFTKLMCLFRRYWRSQVLRAVVHIDHGLCAENGKQPARAASQLVLQTLEQAEFAVHLVK